MLTTEYMQGLAVEAAECQRKAAKLWRWSRFDEAGAFQMAEAAQLLRVSAANLERISEVVLQALPAYQREPGSNRRPRLVQTQKEQPDAQSAA